MVGDGPDRLKCMKKCKELGIIEKVNFLEIVIKYMIF